MVARIVAPRVRPWASLTGAALAGAVRLAGAQPPDSARAPTVADTGRRAVADSAARDTAVARALRAAAATRPALVDRLGLDRLRLTDVGASVGLARPRNIVASALYAVQADYGELFPGVRLVFGTAFWTSHYTADAVRGFERAVQATLGPDRRDSVRFGSVRVSDVALAADLRWRVPRRRSAVLRPFLGGGLAMHFVDTEGAPLSNTFVEQALDGVAIGLAASAGLDVAVLPNVSLTMQARYDLFSGAHFPSVRAGASYVLDAASWRGGGAATPAARTRDRAGAAR
jgi:opacity protein-like surface antigen